MKVTLAESAGFCFGVQRAVDVVKKQILEQKQTQLQKTKIYAQLNLI